MVAICPSKNFMKNTHLLLHISDQWLAGNMNLLFVFVFVFVVTPYNHSTCYYDELLNSGRQADDPLNAYVDWCSLVF